MEKKNIEEKEFNHVPVMLKECIDGLAIKSNGIYVDGTLGGGGHSSEILKRIKTGKLIAIDKDEVAISFCRKRFEKESDKIIFVHSDFKDFRSVLSQLGIDKVDGILLDLGVSSYQIDTPERGFSYRFDGPLDMRMNKDQKKTAYDVVNDSSAEELLKILYNYGEESFAKLIVNAIVKERNISPIKTTCELVKIIENAVPMKYKLKGSPYKKTFQAIRIEVNGELGGLEGAINEMSKSLNKGGRLVIMTFHSLEDRIVKNAFNLLCTDCICDKSLPVCTCHHKAECMHITKKPITASSKELEENKRSSSAKLRIVEKIIKNTLC